MRDYCDFSVPDAKKLLVVLTIVELAFVLIFAADTLLESPSARIHRLFDLDADANIPNWFSSIQLFLIGLVFLLRRRKAGRDAPPSRLFLLMGSAGFVFLSADEAALIHEDIGGFLIHHMAWMPRFKGDYGAWVYLYLLIGIALLLATFREVVSMWRHHRRPTSTMTVGAALYLLGAVGFEVIGFQFLRDGSTPLLYEAEVAIEEFLEMFGASVILYGAVLLLLDDTRASAA